MRIADVRPILLSLPLKSPVSTSFGTMTHRHAILVEVVSEEGVSGIGESWSNFPAWAPAERLATILQGVKPLLVGQELHAVEPLTQMLIGRLERVGLQWGARGPIFQAISAVDIAMWDLLGKAAGRPVYALLGGSGGEPRHGAPGGAGGVEVPVYASGLGPDGAVELARPYYEAGVRTLKLKVGFGADVDRRSLMALRSAFPDASLAVDANQAWTYEETLAFAPVLQEFGCRWMEEPVPAPELEALAALRGALPCPLAGGENYYGAGEFARVLDHGALGLVQPDVCKTGGLTEMVRICRDAVRRGLPYAPHYLGSAVGLVASLHLFAAVPGGLLMELDANPNPLREELLTEPLRMVEGRMAVPGGAGLGIALNPETVARYRVER